MTVVSGSGFQFSVDSTGGVWRWSVVSRSLPGVGVFYEVHDVLTPWGPLSQAAIPIPAEVVTAMAETIVQIQQQLAPLLALSSPYQTSFFVVITEGDPNVVAADIPFVNAGAFGSALTATAVPGSPWLRATPGSVPGLGKNEQASFSVTVLTGSLLETGSPYLGVVNLQDNRVPSTVIPIAFSITVLPRPVIAASPASVGFIWYHSIGGGSGPFTVTVSNAGPANSILNWSVARLHNTSPWLAFSPLSGGPLAIGADEDVTLSIVSGAAASLVPGTYTDSLRFSSPNAQNGYVDVPVSLVVTA